MTITSSGQEDAWQRQCLIEVSDGTTHLKLHSLTETIDISIGERELDVINLLNLGQIAKHGSHGLTTVTFEGYAKEAGTSDGTGDQTATGFWDIFAEKPAKDTSEPQEVSISNTAKRFRIAILWTNETGATAADEAITNTNKAKRFVLADCSCTGHKDDFTDGILKTTLTFKGRPFDNSSSANILMQSIDGGGSGSFNALTTYDPGTTKW